MSAREVARGPRAGGVTAALLLAAGLGTPGCYTADVALLRTGLDSLRTQVAQMDARDSVSARTVANTHQELSDQKDLLLATRATAVSTSRETGETLGRLEGKLDDIMARFRIVSERQPRPAPAPPAATGSPPAGGAGATPGNANPSTAGTGSPVSPPAGVGATVPTGSGATGAPTGTGADPTQLYDQATADLTQGRYPMALTGYREFLRRFPDSDLADNAQYGAGECFFAQARFDSALVEYGHVTERWASGDRAPAALYKQGLCEERLGHSADSRKTFEDLVSRFPQSGEAQLARDRIGAKH